MKIALCQIDTMLGRLDRNLVKINNYTQKAIDEECDIIIFPELSISGYGLRDLVENVSLKPTDDILDDIKIKSRKIDIVLGYPELSDGYFYNSAVYFSKGEILYNYRKNFLPDYGMFEEGRYFKEGNRIDTVETIFGKTTILICEDAFHLSALKTAQNNNTKLMIILSASPFWMDSKNIKPDMWKTLSMNFAQLSGSYVIFVNRVGFEDGIGFFGSSFVVDPYGSIVNSAMLFKEEMLMVNIKNFLSDKAKITMPILKNEDI